MLRILVCGGRDFDDKEYLFKVLDKLYSRTHVVVIIHGDARGADTLAGEWAEEKGIVCLAEPAKWDKYGKSAGYKRNVEMANMNPHLVVAFKGGRGTNMMIRIAKERNIKVLEV